MYIYDVVIKIDAENKSDFSNDYKLFVNESNSRIELAISLVNIARSLVVLKLRGDNRQSFKGQLMICFKRHLS